MKLRKKILAAVAVTTALVLGATSFVSCSNGDDDDEKSGGDFNGQQIITITAPTSVNLGSEVEVKYTTSVNLKGLFGVLCIETTDGSYIIKKTSFDGVEGMIKILATETGKYSSRLYAFDEDVASEADEEDFIDSSEAALVTSLTPKVKYYSNEITVTVTDGGGYEGFEMKTMTVMISPIKEEWVSFGAIPWTYPENIVDSIKSVTISASSSSNVYLTKDFHNQSNSTAKSLTITSNDYGNWLEEDTEGLMIAVYVKRANSSDKSDVSITIDMKNSSGKTVMKETYIGDLSYGMTFLGDDFNDLLDL